VIVYVTGFEKFCGARFAGLMDAPIKSIVGTNPFNEIVPGNFTFIESEVIVQIKSSRRPGLSDALNMTLFNFFSDEGGVGDCLSFEQEDTAMMIIVKQIDKDLIVFWVIEGVCIKIKIKSGVEKSSDPSGQMPSPGLSITILYFLYSLLV
jgi:hypothetical protein